MEAQPMGKMLILLGGVIVVVGVLLMFFDKIPFIGKLPGDISIKRDNFQFYFPLTTSLLLSVVVSFVVWLITQVGKK